MVIPPLARAGRVFPIPGGRHSVPGEGNREFVLMPKGYVLAEVEVTDPATFEAYRAQVPATIAAYGGRFLVRGGETVRLEGDHPAKRFVILEFDSPEQASAWYHSEQYGPAKALRLKSAITQAFLLTGAES
jgi:uncharacterized protein (DUF1330 family)